MIDRDKVQRLVHVELARIGDVECADAIRRLLVEPHCEHREWDYSEAGHTYPCWVLLEHPPSNTCLVYSEHGFGPTSPWGLLFIGGGCTSMGADYQWYSRLEDVFRASQARDGANPDGYEIP